MRGLAPSSTPRAVTHDIRRAATRFSSWPRSLAWLASWLLVAPLAAQTAAAEPPASDLRLIVQPAFRAQAAPALQPAIRDLLPHTAQGKRTLGFVLLGAGVVHMLLTPICFSAVDGDFAHAACVAHTAVLGLAAITVGVVMLVQGYRGRARYLADTQPNTLRIGEFTLRIAGDEPPTAERLRL